MHAMLDLTFNISHQGATYSFKSLPVIFLIGFVMLSIDRHSILADSEDEFVSKLAATAENDPNADIVALSDVLRQRRELDLRDLPVETKVEFIASRCEHVLPGFDQLASCLSKPGAKLKFGIDPTGAEVHLGHAVPIILADRLQRMGLSVDFIVGDITARIGDPSGRSADRPSLTPEDIAANLATYREQISPFFNFEKARFHFNSAWLEPVTLPELLSLLSRIPVSMTMQREDFRKRMASGAGLSMAEQLYSVVMALDSVALDTDIEIGGVDQLLNMQMCRKVMSERGQEPELILTTALIEGIDGSGVKMSKSQGNYVPLAAPPNEIFGRIMAVPDRLVQVYLAALTEITNDEIRKTIAFLHPMAAKRLLAHTVTAILCGGEGAQEAQVEFQARFSKRSFQDLDLPVVKLRCDDSGSFLEILHTGWLSDRSRADIRRVARQGGLRFVSDDSNREFRIDEESLRGAVRDVFAKSPFSPVYLRAGKKIARIGED